MTEQVGRSRRAVAAVARELGCDWHTVNDAVIGYGALLVEHPDRIGPVTAIGLDETLFTRTGTYRTLVWATTIADVGDHRLIDITPGRDTEAVIDWCSDADSPQQHHLTIRCCADRLNLPHVCWLGGPGILDGSGADPMVAGGWLVGRVACASAVRRIRRPGTPPPRPAC